MALAILARINYQIHSTFEDLRKFFKKGEGVTISHYLEPRQIVFLNVESRNVALSQLVDTLDAAGKLLDKQAFYQAILEREKIVSTGIGIEVAIPHAKLAGYHDFFIAIGIQKQPGLEWNAIDGLPVRIIFMIGGPENRQTQYLKILSLITMAIKDEERRKRLLKAQTPKEVIEAFQGL
ncbi:MAG TPA: PTS sugar transporter subunit IIA [Rhabdochlamydiaceae bacterium]|nr:PTS sugar transporter subunit IIA [Rhabdochlamydiaceae bacterium]